LKTKFAVIWGGMPCNLVGKYQLNCLQLHVTRLWICRL